MKQLTPAKKVAIRMTIAAAALLGATVGGTTFALADETTDTAPPPVVEVVPTAPGTPAPLDTRWD